MKPDELIRINSAHLNIEGAIRIIKNARAVSDKIAILIDTKGPKYELQSATLLFR